MVIEIKIFSFHQLNEKSKYGFKEIKFNNEKISQTKVLVFNGSNYVP